jgi:glycosyltransferase involved in cell wall biosynthesis
MDISSTALEVSAVPMVTVIATVYNRLLYLRHALQSAINQTFRSVEIIVTDDSCSDAIRSIVNSFNSPLIRYRCNPSTLGVALNLRSAIKEARGKYVAILNDDDVWEPDFLDMLVAPLEQDSSRVLSFSDHWIITGEGIVDRQKTDENTVRYGRDALLVGVVANPVGLVLEQNGVPLAMASVFRKDAVDWELLVKDVSGAYDFWISCLLVSTGRPIYFIPERLTRYRVHAAMETARKVPDKNENMVYIYSKLLGMALFPDKKTLLTSRYSQALFQVGKDSIYFNRCQLARSYFMYSLKTNITFKAMAGFCISFLPRMVRTALNYTKP